MGKYSKYKEQVPTYKEALEDEKKKLRHKTRDDLLELFTQLKEEKNKKEKELKVIDQKLTAASERLVEILEEENLTSIKHSKLGTFTIKDRVFAQQVDKNKLFKWLREQGYETLIKEDVNSNSLNSVMGDILSNGESLPKDAGVKLFFKSSISNLKS